MSVIIVNYNVKYFLEQCLLSVQKAASGLDTEVMVIDNQSKDGSLEYLVPKFPDVKFISNKNNTGFANACNNGLANAKGEFVLFLNPDTILPEDCFQKCISFFEAHSHCGALGVKMIDGLGKFLKESKRSFPSPLTSLFKLFGLSAIFPKSKWFGRYHLGHLDTDTEHEVDVLAGAFMMIRKKVLDEVGGFDESFFMYGEDVDLSYRIQKAGYKNYYFPGTTIIHFKGESTKRGSLNYVKVFYKAMSVFVRKHYGGAKAGVFTASIHVAIWIRAAIAAMNKFTRRIALPLLDALLIFISFWLVSEVGMKYVNNGIVFSNRQLIYSFAPFTILYLGVAYYAGLYDKYYRTAKLIRTVAITTFFALIIYALVLGHFSVSASLIVSGGLLAFILINVLRILLIRSGHLIQPPEKILQPYILVAGTKEEFDKVKDLLQQKKLSEKIAGRVSLNEQGEKFLSTPGNDNEAIQFSEIKEVIFCSANLSYKKIIGQVQSLKKVKARFFSGNSIIGSDGSTAKGEALAFKEEFKLATTTNRRLKRLIDVSFSLLSISIFPVQFLFVKKSLFFLRNCCRVLAGSRTWVGYNLRSKQLPVLRTGVIATNGIRTGSQEKLSEENLKMLDYQYAKDYEPLQDVILILKNYRYLGG